ncbi:MAG: hydantoinase B/oxoprolinase family protein, partial [bacterium]|nr:hydantoinase B/oxoprolinase family protein [bacterium]
MLDRIIHPPRGRNGGASGTAGKIYLKSGKTLQGKGRQTIPAGDSVVLEMPGGGGLGDPVKRDPARLAIDVRDGFVSAEQASENYGWRGIGEVVGDD